MCMIKLPSNYVLNQLQFSFVNQRAFFFINAVKKNAQEKEKEELKKCHVFIFLLLIQSTLSSWNEINDFKIN